jgi:hypothetical protein
VQVVVHVGPPRRLQPRLVIPLPREAEEHVLLRGGEVGTGPAVAAEGLEGAVPELGAGGVGGDPGSAEVVGGQVAPGLPAGFDRELGDRAAGEVEDVVRLAGIAGGDLLRQRVEEAAGGVDGAGGAGGGGFGSRFCEVAPAVVGEGNGVAQPVGLGDAAGGVGGGVDDVGAGGDLRQVAGGAVRKGAGAADGEVDLGEERRAAAGSLERIVVGVGPAVPRLGEAIPSGFPKSPDPNSPATT